MLLWVWSCTEWHEVKRAIAMGKERWCWQGQPGTEDSGVLENSRISGCVCGENQNAGAWVINSTQYRREVFGEELSINRK